MFGKKFLKLKNAIFDSINFEPMLISNRITEFELLCALKELYKITNYMTLFQ